MCALKNTKPVFGGYLLKYKENTNTEWCWLTTMPSHTSPPLATCWDSGKGSSILFTRDVMDFKFIGLHGKVPTGYSVVCVFQVSKPR